MKVFMARAVLFSFLVVPAITFGATTVNVSYIEGIFTQLALLLNTLLPIIIALAVIFFLWGLLKFMMAAGDESAKEEGKRIMIWGVVILFVMLSVWGLVAILNELTGIGQGGTVAPPTLGV